MTIQNQRAAIDSERARPAIFWAMVEFHRVANGWLQDRPARGRTGCRPQIMRSLLQATTALSKAATGAHREARLRRAREAVIECEAGLILLHDVLGEEILARAMDRIDQLLAGIAQLEALDVSEWAKVALPPLASPSVDAHHVLVTTMRRIAVAIRAVLESKQVGRGSDHQEEVPRAATG